jgi:cytochrome c
MLGALVIVSMAAAGALSGNAGKGKVVFGQCSVCHNAASNVKKVGPGLKGLFKKAKMQNGKAPTEANVRAVVDAGGNGMPPYKQALTAAQREDLIAYLKTL